MPRIELKEVTVAFPGGNGAAAPALDGVDLEVGEGEMVVVVGPSGAGKSTLLRVIAGLERPARGTVLLSGRPAGDLPPEQRDVAMTFQAPALFPHLSVEENLALGARLRGRKRAVALEEARGVAQRLGLAEFLPRMPDALSGGEKQRVAMGRAMVARAGVLLLDEPFSGMDSPARRGLVAEMLRFHEQSGASVLYVTHDQHEALGLGRRLVLLRSGRVEQTGMPEVLYRRPDTRFGAGFFGFPPMNLVAGEAGLVAGQPVFRAAGSSRVLPLRGDAADLAQVAMRPAVLGIRPEDLQIVPDGVWDGRVVGREFGGLQIWLRVEGWAGQLWVRGSGSLEEEVGSGVRLLPEPGRVLLFDPETGRRWRR